MGNAEFVKTNPVPSATGNRGAGLEAEAEAGNLAFFSAARPTRGALMVAATGVIWNKVRRWEGKMEKLEKLKDRTPTAKTIRHELVQFHLPMRRYRCISESYHQLYSLFSPLIC